MKNKNRIFIAAIVLTAVIISLFLSPLASKQPDGLEKVAENFGFAEKAGNFFNVNFVMADYVFPGIKSSYWQTSFSGFFGVLIILAIFALIFGIIFLVQKNKRSKNNPVKGENKDRFQYKKL
jgi:cobalt/nickel transport protein